MKKSTSSERTHQPTNELMPFSLRSNNQSGQVFVLGVIVLSLMMVTVLVIMTGAFTFSQNARYTVNALKAIALAEAGVDKAIASLNTTGGTYTGEEETQLGEGSFSVTITTQGNTKIIESTGYIPNKANPKSHKTVRVEASSGIGASFNYGVQVGEGGLQLGHGNRIFGSVYSNGSVTGDHDNSVDGDVWVAGGPQPNPDQETDCSGVNCTDFTFGKNVGGENRLDVAQAFMPTENNTLNKISLNIKKTGSPSDAIVRILGNSNGSPDKSNVITSGTLYGSLVSTSYGWIDVTFSSTPQLIANTTYWITVDTSNNSNNFWTWQNDTLQSYNRGAPKWSADWQAKNPTWNNIAGDLSFKTFMGGVITYIDGGNSFDIGGNAHANTLQNVDVAGDAYYQSISSSSVGGTSNPGSEDPPPKVFPISEANILEWKQQAEAAGVQTGDITNCPAQLGPKKIIGNVTLDNNCNITVKSPVWITGNLVLNNSNILTLDSSYGSTSGLIIVDGLVELFNNNKLQGTGVGTSILMLLSTYDSRTNDITAIDVKNNGNSGFLYAGTGIIQPGTNNSYRELTAWGIRLTVNTDITYETGLSSTLFSSGPTGSFSVIKGSYQIK